MKLRATITIDIDVPDYISAGENQKRLHEWFEDLHAKYENVSLEIRERRATQPRRLGAAPMMVRHPSGKVSSYEEVA